MPEGWTFESALAAAGVTANTLATSQKSDLDEKGYFVAPDVIDEGELARLRKAWGRDGSGTEHVALSAVTPDIDAWLHFAIHPVLLAAAWHVLRRPFRIGQLHGRNPLPGYGQQGLHTDWPARAPGDAYAVVTVIGMFDDFTEENGATRVIPGSHLTPCVLPKKLAQPLAHHPEERLVTGRAGSVLIFNGHTLHSGTKNRSTAPRRAAQMVILGREHASTAPSRYAEAEVPALIIRDPLAAYFFGL